MILTKKSFCLHVEEEFSKNDLSMIDTVLLACEEFNIDPALVEPLINRSVKEKIKREFVNLNLLKSSDTVII